MSQDDQKRDEQMEAYSTAATSGLYDKRSGLRGKYDNVRLYWEDEITRYYLRPHLQKLIERSRALMRRVRVLDLGCGSADGYELLISVRQREPSLQSFEVGLLTPEVFGQYTGVDLNEDLLKQASSLYGHNPKMSFRQANFTEGLPLLPDEAPYDLYFMSYGTTSHHNEDETLIELLADIARRTEDYSIVMCDWLGRYAYEWQTLWTDDLAKNRNMDYVVSYIYEKEEREELRDQLQHLTLRLMCREEIDSVVAEASKRAGVEIRPLGFFDRSVFTGRHMDTGDYNPHAQPLRAAVNSLHEPNLRTDLNSLLIDYAPKPGFDFVNEYFEHVQMCWNTLVTYTARLMEEYDPAQRRFATAQSVPPSYPAPLRKVMERMRHVVEGVGWFDIGLPRENIIEPQLGHSLRYLIMELQEGQGCAHGLAGIFEVDKRT